MTVLTVEEFKEALPAKVKKSVNQELIDAVNATFSDPDMFETYRENLLSYTRVMQEGRFKVTNYITAVKYVSFKLMGMSNTEAYSRTFPEKIKRFAAQGVVEKDVASYITAYNKSKLVNLIYEQTMTPFWVLNQENYQKALNVQVELMVAAKSEKVRSDAANSVLTHLKPPEAQKIELDISTTESDSVRQLREATLKLVEETRRSIGSGAMTAEEAANRPVTIDAEDGELVE